MSTAQTALPYHEPSVAVILIEASFLIALNVINNVLDRGIYCGLVGQILLGTAWGTPGSKWLPIEAQESMVQIGYLGLILIVYEGGLATSVAGIRSNLLLSIATAFTGICLPMALSFVLITLNDATPLQAFAAGAALCSTSLGTTFTVLESSGLTNSRLGTVLASAAMMDDVVGLIMVQIIASLGQAEESFGAVTVIRPVACSIALVVILLITCRFVARPMRTYLTTSNLIISHVRPSMTDEHWAFLIHTLGLLGSVAAASYAGTSGLFAAYLFGAAVTWWDSLGVSLPGKTRMHQSPPGESNANHPDVAVAPTRSPQEAFEPSDTCRRPVESCADGTAICHTGADVYESYYSTVVTRMLKPFFFASIGFAIPITSMFTGAIVWRGLVYTLLMILGKLFTGMWLVSFPTPSVRATSKHYAALIKLFLKRRGIESEATSRVPRGKLQQSGTTETVATGLTEMEPTAISTVGSSRLGEERNRSRPVLKDDSRTKATASKEAPKPRSLYPATILGSAMVARGEIGFLIASLAQSQGIFSDSKGQQMPSSSASSDIYLVVIWAITLCTIIGPLSVGLIVKRVKRLQSMNDASGRGDPLGAWGVL